MNWKEPSSKTQQSTHQATHMRTLHDTELVTLRLTWEVTKCCSPGRLLISPAMWRQAERCQEALPLPLPLPLHSATDSTETGCWDSLVQLRDWVRCVHASLNRGENEMRIAKYSEMFELTKDYWELLLHITAAHHSNSNKVCCSTLVEFLCCWFNCLGVISRWFGRKTSMLRKRSNRIKYYNQSSQGQHYWVQYYKWDKRFDIQDQKRIKLKLWNVNRNTWLNIRNNFNSSNQSCADFYSRIAFQILK
jgi:hypothetical protein